MKGRLLSLLLCTLVVLACTSSQRQPGVTDGGRVAEERDPEGDSDSPTCAAPEREEGDATVTVTTGGAGSGPSYSHTNTQTSPVDSVEVSVSAATESTPALDFALGTPGRFKGGCAVVTTWARVPREWARQWILWHAALGFDRLFIFWDRPEEDEDTIGYVEGKAELNSVVRNVRSTRAFRDRYWNPPNANATTMPGPGPSVRARDPEQMVLPVYGVHAESEVNARQSLHATRAAVLAREEGLSWVLHIDADELFLPFVPSDFRHLYGSARRLFLNLSARGFTHARFQNDEIFHVPGSFKKPPPKDKDKDKEEGVQTGEDSSVRKGKSKTVLSAPFKKNSLFKRNTQTQVMRQPRAHQLVNQWVSSRRHVTDRFFLGYICGKGAINIAEWDRRNPGQPIVHNNVVAYAAFSEEILTGMRLTKFSIQDSYAMIQELPTQRVKKMVFFETARILHYINSDIASLVRKYSTTLSSEYAGKRFDPSLVTEAQKEKFKNYKDLWLPAETMPNNEFYENIRKAVQADVKSGRLPSQQEKEGDPHASSEESSGGRLASAAAAEEEREEEDARSGAREEREAATESMKMLRVLEFRPDNMGNGLGDGMRQVGLVWESWAVRDLIADVKSRLKAARAGVRVEAEGEREVEGGEREADEEEGAAAVAVLRRLSRGLRELERDSGGEHEEEDDDEDEGEDLKTYGCKDLAPHYECDWTHCCTLLRNPTFTFEKRLLGYIRYEHLEWWRRGLQWKGRPYPL
uniref:Glycosyltransferase family 92 protein n=1 Tax=Chromera velia CCMP2878 TaxID=1169474 RepID=A0A0G4FRQ5_9ALVE|eukprot:Cvel_18326.t1-p1 / transcript=Cvel_18326.t1 / gene=Cvel_18326 / organism=Chromera_velia_CCMP2878 / gene_product=hypothetical protein / transcript_product=hypothetical protein / location=Cvel_scaffold1512:31077-39271(-) / protein_length=748 / sequence_SO=supercontig / SO=protein_coding / is_pseudo=false